MVLSENPETSDVENKEVLETYENETEELIHVHVGGEDIITTPSHPFYVNQFGWTRAAQLRAGDVLVLSNGEYVVVEFIQHEILESPVKVYNLEVEDYHTYFVGDCSVLVHNGCEIDEENLNSKKPAKTKAEILAQNRKNGRAFEIQQVSEFKQTASEVREQITIKTNEGTRFRIDAIGIDENGNLVLQEYKSSLTAPLTDNQIDGFEELKRSGGVIVGKGKGDIFKDGYVIPSGTEVDIIRKGGT